jgi:hypothetical protein
MKAPIVGAVAVAAVAYAIPALAQINFDRSLIPSLTSSLPIFSLGHPQILPASIVDGIVICPACGYGKISATSDEAGRYYHANGTLVAFTDNTTGETSILPRLESLRPAANGIPLGAIEQYLKDQQIFPADHTRIRAQKGNTLSGNMNDNHTVTAPADYLTDIWINRTVAHKDGEVSICGPGTKAFFSFGADGNVKALSYRWRPATRQSSGVKPVSADGVYDSILHQLAAANVANATVDRVELCYYDSGDRFIQPVLRWSATVPAGLTGVSPEPVLGHIAAALQPPELVPNITAPTTTNGLTNDVPNKNPTQITRAAKRQQGIKVGLYPMKNDGNTPIYDDDVHNFYNALATSTLGSFVRAQDYWGKAFEYENRKEEFVDSVNIALTRGHGSEHMFYTDELDPNWGDVAISDIPVSGFGPSAHGSLAYWIISTCDTVSTSADYSAANFHLAYDPWWNVFNGMHAVVGFRSEKLTNDGVTLPFAKVLAAGGGFVWSWLNTVNQSPYYNPNSAYGTNSQTGQKIWYGRPSAVVVCGHTDDTVLQRQDLGRATCLQQWWYY